MNKYIDIPFLPSRKVKSVIVDKRIPQSLENKIRAEGINIIKTSKCKDIYDAISCHPDILLFHLGGNKIVVAPNIYNKMKNSLEEVGMKVIKGNTMLKSTYPADVAYNVGRVGEYAIHNFKYTDKLILRSIEEKGIKKIHVSQGYAKCSIAIINENAIITSDKGIEREALKFGIDTLLIEPGNVRLPGLDYGFIGGASGLIEKNTILFFGNIKKHPEYKKIAYFLKKHDIIMKFEEEELIDLGSIIPIL